MKQRMWWIAKRLLVVAVCVAIVVTGFEAWRTDFWSYGYEHFDQEFLAEFDADYIFDHFDELRNTGLFDYGVMDAESESSSKFLNWPKGGKALPESDFVSFELVSEEYYHSEGGYGIFWQTVRYYNKFSVVPVSFGDNKYVFTIGIGAHKGRILYTLSGKTKKECIDRAQETLLYLMRLAEE